MTQAKQRVLIFEYFLALRFTFLWSTSTSTRRSFCSLRTWPKLTRGACIKKLFALKLPTRTAHRFSAMSANTRSWRSISPSPLTTRVLFGTPSHCRIKQAIITFCQSLHTIAPWNNLHRSWSISASGEFARHVWQALPNVSTTLRTAWNVSFCSPSSSSNSAKWNAKAKKCWFPPACLWKQSTYHSDATVTPAAVRPRTLCLSCSRRVANGPRTWTLTKEWKASSTSMDPTALLCQSQSSMSTALQHGHLPFRPCSDITASLTTTNWPRNTSFVPPTATVS